MFGFYFINFVASAPLRILELSHQNPVVGRPLIDMRRVLSDEHLRLSAPLESLDDSSRPDSILIHRKRYYRDHQRPSDDIIPHDEDDIHYVIADWSDDEFDQFPVNPPDRIIQDDEWSNELSYSQQHSVDEEESDFIEWDSSFLDDLKTDNPQDGRDLFLENIENQDDTSSAFPGLDSSESSGNPQDND